jgi:hypothetical protein
VTALQQRILQKPILVFLPDNVAQVIVSRLLKHGYAANAVSSIPVLFDALRSEAYALVVTTRPDIDIVRNIKSLPVVNLEVFFHKPLDEAGESARKQFDGAAFLKRIRSLTEPRPNRDGRARIEGEIITSAVIANRIFQWWNAARHLVARRAASGLGD